MFVAVFAEAFASFLGAPTGKDRYCRVGDVDCPIFCTGWLVNLAPKSKPKVSPSKTLGLFEGEGHPSAHITDSPDTDAQM
jgi:hypothetical protein